MGIHQVIVMSSQGIISKPFPNVLYGSIWSYPPLHHQVNQQLLFNMVCSSCTTAISKLHHICFSPMVLEICFSHWLLPCHELRSLFWMVGIQMSSLICDINIELHHRSVVLVKYLHIDQQSAWAVHRRLSLPNGSRKVCHSICMTGLWLLVIKRPWRFVSKHKWGVFSQLCISSPVQTVHDWRRQCSDNCVLWLRILLRKMNDLKEFPLGITF